ncbi:hypothetical protein B1C78_04725 [Thioalkalivibrio denitrificans]|uniref:Uncharacterized protein n=1 Tax=Thioalkalivibrio denitrificans TaxID=108003 RepID=A0A1V3NMY8_9GAMM|nr:hypothetical protein [Thioalkalivibrio denitrificans]OOG26467.1 hypothetical protein B1C78_04725 [Thioalkalivibrio denitrificans]
MHIARYLSIFFLLLFPGLPPAHAEPLCDHAYCYTVAERTELLAEPASGIRLDIAGFHVSVPPPERIVADGETLYLHLGNDAVLVIGPERLPQLRDAGVTIVPNQIPKMIFLKTPEDAAFLTQEDEKVWRFALSLKRYHFENASHALHVRHAGIHYFLSDGDLVGFSGQALITRTEQEDYFLRIDALNMDFQGFKRIVLSVH